ncbi:MAG: ATP synthase F1 subunit delta [Oscillospiraceae bacterium]|nr:ATP synthase F1 subunit delta [Oscillospiraceae bacterium]
MTEIANVYGGALYDLAKDENLVEQLHKELSTLDQAFAQEPGFIGLLSSANLPKPQRVQVIEDSFRSNFHPYILNFLKILTEKGYIRHFSGCCKVFFERYNTDNGILPVTAVTAVPLSDALRQKLTDKLSTVTGKRIALTCKVDPDCLGGVRLDYDGKRLDDTVSHRLDSVRGLLKNTVL